MRYEVVMILKPTLSDEERTEAVEKYHKILSDTTAKVVNAKEIGNKELAYEIKGFKTGYYYLYEIEASDDSTTREFDRVASISDEVIRHLVTRKGE